MIRTPSLSIVKKAVDKFPANVAIIDEGGVIVHVNDSWVEFARENGVVESVPTEGTNYLSAVEADDSETARDALSGIRRVLSGEMSDFEQTYPCHNPNEKQWFTMRIAGFEHEGVRYASIVHVNITRRKQRKQELELFESIFRNQIGLALMFDESGEVILGNTRLYEVIDITPADVVGTSISDLERILPAREQNINELKYLTNQVLRKGTEIAVDAVDFLIGGDNRMTTDVQIFPYEIDEYTNGAILTARNVTKWRARERQLSLYQRAVEGSSEMLTALDEEYTYLFANEAYRQFHGLDGKELSNTSIFDILEGDDLKQVQEHLDGVFEGERIEYSHERMGPNGRNHPLNVRYYPLRDENGEIMGAVAAMQDMTEQRERERHLLVLDRVLRHNMNNDMNIIHGYADLVKKEGEGEIATYGKKISETANALLDTVNKQRHIIEVLSQSPDFEPIDLVDEIEAVIASIELDYPESDITFSSPQSVSLQTIVQIKVAIREIVENAVVHASMDKSTVEVRVVESDGRALVEVADEGPGIPEEERGVLTGEMEIGPLFHGSGMGLWMVNWIVSRANGSLKFSSRDPSGSLVTIELPKQD